MLTYYKGWKGNIDFFAVYDDEAPAHKEKEDWLDCLTHYPVTIITVGDVNGTEAEYNSIEEAQENGYYFAREITQAEYKIYCALKGIYREVRMHDITGGYPRQEAIQHAMSNLRCELMRWMTAIKE